MMNFLAIFYLKPQSKTWFFYLWFLSEQVCSIIAKMLGKLRGILELFDMVGKEDDVKQLLAK